MPDFHESMIARFRFEDRLRGSEVPISRKAPNVPPPAFIESKLGLPIGSVALAEPQPAAVSLTRVDAGWSLAVPKRFAVLRDRDAAALACDILEGLALVDAEVRADIVAALDARESGAAE